MGFGSMLGRAVFGVVYGIPQGFREAKEAIREARDTAEGVLPGSTEEERKAQLLTRKLDRIERETARDEAARRRSRQERIARLETEITILSAVGKARKTAMQAHLSSLPEGEEVE